MKRYGFCNETAYFLLSFAHGYTTRQIRDVGTIACLASLNDDGEFMVLLLFSLSAPPA